LPYPGLAPFGARASAGHFACKRLFDLIGSLLLLLALLPLLLLVAVAIKIDSPGPVLFTQRRTGRGSQPFRIYKFRTMTVREDGSRVVQATSADERVTRLGRFLRRSSIDEIPQLLNILTGDMSLVGPRPHALAHDAYYGSHIPEYGCRFSVRPGLTGLAQVSGLRGEIHDIQCMRERVAADLAYIEKWSLRLDLQVLLRTIWVVVRDEHAY
jgi:putative colanic acid biosynthesis UDP-glucose lipid carrier transferase